MGTLIWRPRAPFWPYLRHFGPICSLAPFHRVDENGRNRTVASKVIPFWKYAWRNSYAIQIRMGYANYFAKILSNVNHNPIATSLSVKIHFRKIFPLTFSVNLAYAKILHIRIRIWDTSNFAYQYLAYLHFRNTDYYSARPFKSGTTAPIGPMCPRV